jgi:very-short-patch-repair endonuclease
MAPFARSTAKSRTKSKWPRLSIAQRELVLRQKATPEERLLCRLLSDDPRTLGKFRHQGHLMGYYPDFSFPNHKLIVELDGAVHCSARAKLADAKRSRSFTKAGWRVIRFWNSSLRNPSDVIEAICAAMNQPVILI